MSGQNHFIPLLGLALVSACSGAFLSYVLSLSKTNKTPKLKLYYFDIPGKAEAIRLLCTYSNLSFEDIRLTRAQFEDLRAKNKLSFGQVPALDVNEGTILVQSAAIMRYLGKLSGLYPSDPLLAAKVDAVMDEEADLLTGLSVSKYSCKSPTHYNSYHTFLFFIMALIYIHSFMYTIHVQLDLALVSSTQRKPSYQPSVKNLITIYYRNTSHSSNHY